jgi:hypothetical protein
MATLSQARCEIVLDYGWPLPTLPPLCACSDLDDAYAIVGDAAREADPSATRFRGLGSSVRGASPDVTEDRGTDDEKRDVDGPGDPGSGAGVSPSLVPAAAAVAGAMSSNAPSALRSEGPGFGAACVSFDSLDSLIEAVRARHQALSQKRYRAAVAQVHAFLNARECRLFAAAPERGGSVEDDAKQALSSRRRGRRRATGDASDARRNEDSDDEEEEEEEYVGAEDEDEDPAGGFEPVDSDDRALAGTDGAVGGEAAGERDGSRRFDRSGGCGPAPLSAMAMLRQEEARARAREAEDDESEESEDEVARISVSEESAAWLLSQVRGVLLSVLFSRAASRARARRPTYASLLALVINAFARGFPGYGTQVGPAHASSCVLPILHVLNDAALYDCRYASDAPPPPRGHDHCAGRRFPSLAALATAVKREVRV